MSDTKLCIVDSAIAFELRTTRSGVVARVTPESLARIAPLLARFADRDGGRVRFELETKTVDVPTKGA